jgi:riboflavin biosynthesis pyrimidine reductase
MSQSHHHHQHGKVRLTVHMLVSLDGKTNLEVLDAPSSATYLKEYYRIDNDILKRRSQVCLCGRKSIEPLAVLEDPKNYPAADKKGDRSDFHADVETNPVPAANHYFAIIDPHGRLGWTVSEFNNKDFPFYNGDRIVEVLVENFVTDEFLAQLRKANVPYIFAGESALDCRLALEKLGKLFKTDAVVCHGGGTVNGSFLEQGAVDHLSLLLIPAVSGDPASISLFNPLPGKKLPMTEFDLEHVEKLPDGGLWLEYKRKA